MRTPLLKDVIEEVTLKAYQNVNDWMRSDPYIASQLRDGLRSALEAFDEIDDQPRDTAYLLQEMLHKLEKPLSYYGQLPGSQGEWECSALSIVKCEINRLIEEGYTGAQKDEENEEL